MRMHNPPHPGRVLREYLGMVSVTDAAKHLGVTRVGYLAQSAEREPWQFTPDASMRARGIELWAAIRSLGRSGLREMIERNCRQARMFADCLRAAGSPS
jgi:glutamate/tyrosine decarboxylase-like PLP-dependent enzyme